MPNHRLSRALILAAAAWLPCAMAIGAQDPAKRYSLAISGGASMGAYEAGLNWGILHFLRRYGQTDAVLGGENRPLTLTSVAGASAGGINSILSGLVWCARETGEGGLVNRLDDNLFRDVWLSIDINDLLPLRPDSPRYLPGDGLLSRSSIVKAASHLKQAWNRPHFRPGCRLPLGVTVTRVKPARLEIDHVTVQNQRFTIPFELRVGADGTIAYGFDPKAYGAERDLSMLLMPHRAGDARRRIPDRAIEELVLASAAYPIAFGRLRLQTCQLALESSRATETPAAPTPTSELQCPEGYELNEAEFADGGLFDNIPLGLARKLAERGPVNATNPLPVSYIYLDPDPVRFRSTVKRKASPCERPDPPAACREMAFGLIEQGGLLGEAYGSARKYELFREITSDHWRLNLGLIGRDLIQALELGNPRLRCERELPWFDQPLSCREALDWSLRLLETAYRHRRVPLGSPLSAERLRQRRLASGCRPAGTVGAGVSIETCRFDVPRYRRLLGRAIADIARRSDLEIPDLTRRLAASMPSLAHDRDINVTRRGSPITGSLLGGFGAFLEYKFREYDYLVGIYDAVILAAKYRCGRLFPRKRQPAAYGRCFTAEAKRGYTLLDIDRNPRARYLFARLAQAEFGKNNGLPPFGKVEPDRDMRIIHDALQQSAEYRKPGNGTRLGIFAVEKGFFRHLREQGFQPTRQPGRKRPLLSEVMDDPDQWLSEFVRRATNRLVYLEQQAERIHAQRDPESRLQPAMTRLVAASAYLLQTSTYKYPTFDFAPSTARRNWPWRYVIPYELGFDLLDGDLLFTWQPTWALSNRHALALRASLGLRGGLLNRSNEDRNNYLALGLEYDYLSGFLGLSGLGITPTVYYSFDEPAVGERTTVGGDIHVGVLKNRLRVGLGVRDFDDAGNSWFLQIGIADLPGLGYWMSR